MRFALIFASFLVACPATPEPAQQEEAPKAEEGAKEETPATEEAADAGTAEEAKAEGPALPDFAKLEEAAGKVQNAAMAPVVLAELAGIVGAPSSASATELVWIGSDGSACKALKVTLNPMGVAGHAIEDTACPAPAAAAEGEAAPAAEGEEAAPAAKEEAAH